MSLKDIVKKEDSYTVASRDRLSKNLEAKMKKIYTSALHSIELVYGANNDEFEAVRKSILDSGNDQIRKMREELDGYNVEFIPQTIVINTKERLE
jgi:hypothetical protein